MISWDACKNDFQPDGSLRDIYITPASLSEWRALYSILRNYSGIQYSVDSVLLSPPDTVEQVFAVRPTATPLLRISAGNILVIFHFFSTEEIECDLNPRDVASQLDLDALLGFMQQMGDTTVKRVVLTPENCSDMAIISYDPRNKDFQYHKVAP